ncbi:MAG TPA: hypothetical protein VFN79_17930 [Steroidobacteraceae bacterium]|nr:hypothetical protein [Steroidobacteraceae bacterium]
MTRTFPVTLGSLELEARAEVSGEFRPAVTQADPDYCHPEEWPEADVHTLTVGDTDLSGLLEDTDIYAGVRDQILDQLAEADREGDPDAGDKWRDSQMDKQP